MIRHLRSCGRHRPALVDWVATTERRSATPAALSHLDRCASCRSETESVLLVVTALRRLGDEGMTVEPPADAWPRLRARVARWRPNRPPIMSPVAGMAMSAAIVIALVGSFAGLPGDTPQPEGRTAASELERSQELVEEAWLRERMRPERRAAVTPRPTPAVRPSLPPDRLGPDGLILTASDRLERPRLERPTAAR